MSYQKCIKCGNNFYMALADSLWQSDGIQCYVPGSCYIRKCYKCIITEHLEINELKENNKKLEERLRAVEKLLGEMVSYAPGGKGYKETEDHFNTLIKN